MGVKSWERWKMDAGSTGSTGRWVVRAGSWKQWLMHAGSAENSEIQGVGSLGCWDTECWMKDAGCRELEVWGMGAGCRALGSGIGIVLGPGSWLPSAGVKPDSAGSGLCKYPLPQNYS